MQTSLKHFFTKILTSKAFQNFTNNFDTRGEF